MCVSAATPLAYGVQQDFVYCHANGHAIYMRHSLQSGRGTLRQLCQHVPVKVHLGTALQVLHLVRVARRYIDHASMILMYNLYHADSLAVFSTSYLYQMVSTVYHPSMTQT